MNLPGPFGVSFGRSVRSQAARNLAVQREMQRQRAGGSRHCLPVQILGWLLLALFLVGLVVEYWYAVLAVGAVMWAWSHFKVGARLVPFVDALPDPANLFKR